MDVGKSPSGSAVIRKKRKIRGMSTERVLIETSIQEIIGNNTTPGDAAQKVLGLDPKAREAKLYNTAMGKVNKVGMLDAFVGHDIGEGSQDLKLYFSGSASERELKALIAELSEMQLPAGGDMRANITFQRSDTPGATWVVLVRRPIMGQPQAVGKVGVQGPAAGELAVSR